MSIENKSDVYKEEFKYIFSGKAPRVRGTLVVSALIEGQIFLLAKNFIEKHDIKYEPKWNEEHRQSLNILGSNKILNPKELKDIEDFKKARNEAIHGIFKKGMTYPDWEKQNREVVSLGRPIVKNLDEKLYPKSNIS